MIRTCIVLENNEIMTDVPLARVKEKGVKWYWVDFENPTEQEVEVLQSFFRFHPLAIEDCLDEFSQRPKLDFYDHYIFVLLHAIHHDTLDSHEVNMFVNSQFIVTFHRHSVRDLNNLWDRVKKEGKELTPFTVMHGIIDKLVDDYFIPVYSIEDQLNRLEDDTDRDMINELMDQLFDIRHSMSKLRRSLIPMRDLMYRIINSGRLNAYKEQQLYFQDVYDHLLKLVEMLESYRDFSSDIRDSYLSMNSDKMNNIMMTLTVITTIFMPLTFIVGLYGMNFQHMPELDERYGYYIVLAVMFLIAVTMFGFFVKIGWLHFGVKKKRARKRKRLLRLK